MIEKNSFFVQLSSQERKSKILQIDLKNVFIWAKGDKPVSCRLIEFGENGFIFDHEDFLFKKEIPYFIKFFVGAVSFFSYVW